MPQLTEVEHGKILSSLQAEDKFRRKQALEQVLKNVLGSVEKLDEKSLSEVWEIFHRPIVRMLRDPVEACRDLVLEILKKFLTNLPCSDKNIVYVIPILTKSLGSEELVEPSEEIRLKCIILLRAIVEKYQDKLTSYFEDLTTILKRRVMDKYPKVKEECCDCICEVAKAMPSNFHDKTEVFIKSILVNMSHRHYKIRVTTIQTIGEILLIGNNKCVNDVAHPMAERMFDQSGAVRTAVVEVVGNWLLELKDRYSYWHKLVPHLLTGMNDVVPDIREKATRLWMSVGEKYIRENETDQKFNDQMNTLSEFLPHYPPNIIRPNLGCRTIIQLNISKFLPAVAKELHDWLPDIKLRAAQLLCILILNIEEELIQHMPTIFPSMYRACNDEDKRVVENVELASEYLGYFVPPSVYCELLWPTLDQNPTAGHFKVFAAVLRGSPRNLLAPELKKIGELLGKDCICRSTKGRYQSEILNCCRSILKISKEDCAEIGEDLFKALFTTLAMSVDKPIEDGAIESLKLLAEAEGLENLNQLHEKHLEVILKSVQEKPEEWAINSTEFIIFYGCLTYAKEATYNHLDLIHPVFEKTTTNEIDKKMQLKQYMLLSDYFRNWNEPVDQNKTTHFIDFLNIILEKIIIPGLAWVAGRSAEAIRTASVCCLCAILNKLVDNCEPEDGSGRKYKKFVMSVNNFGWLFEQVRPILVKLLDDDATNTRLYSLQAMCLIMNIGQELNYINEDNIHKTSIEVMGRLEDNNDEVRLAAIEALREVWKVVPKNYDLSFYYVHIEYVYKHMIVHLDDPGEKFQKHTLDCLMDIMKVYPARLIETIEDSRAKFINQKALDQLSKVAQEYLKAHKLEEPKLKKKKPVETESEGVKVTEIDSENQESSEIASTEKQVDDVNNTDPRETNIIYAQYK